MNLKIWKWKQTIKDNRYRNGNEIHNHWTENKIRLCKQNQVLDS